MKKFEIRFGNKTLAFETGRMAKQADGAVVVRYGDTMVIVAVCAARKAKEGTDFFPLTVDYQEKSLEAHFLNFHKNIYGEEIELFFVKKLRSIKRFKSSKTLAGAIAVDMRKALQSLSDRV